MKKVVRYEVHTATGDYVTIHDVEASDMSLTGALVNFVIDEEVSELNPFPGKYVVKSFSVHTLISIVATYEEVESEEA